MRVTKARAQCGEGGGVCVCGHIWLGGFWRMDIVDADAAGIVYPAENNRCIVST